MCIVQQYLDGQRKTKIYEICLENAKEKTIERLVFTDKSDLPAAEGLIEIFVGFPETGKNSTWALDAWEWKKCQWLQDDVKSSREALLCPATSYQEAKVAPHFGVEPPTGDKISSKPGSRKIQFCSWN